MQTVDMDPDLTRGEVTNPMDACAHLEGVGPEMPLEEGGTARENAIIEEDKNPRVKLITITHHPEAARTQRSPAGPQNQTPWCGFGHVTARHLRHDRQTRPRNPLPNGSPSRSEPPPKLEDSWSRSGSGRRGAQRAWWA